MRAQTQRAFRKIEESLLLPGAACPQDELDAARAEMQSADLTGAQTERRTALEGIEQARRAGRPDPGREARYVEEYGVAGVKLYETPSGVDVYRLTVESFPGHFTHTYLVLDGATTFLVDPGAPYYVCEEDFERGLRVVRGYFGERLSDADIRDVFITHGHIDHFGRACVLKERLGCRIHIHAEDASILTDFDKRVDEAAEKIRLLILRSGFDPSRAEKLLEMYRGSKAFFQNVAVDVRLEDGGRLLDRYPVIHTPGHCPGQVCVLVDGLLFVGDHVLSDISPHQAPNYLFPNMGLKTYFASLAKVRRIEGVRLVLPGHQDEIPDLGRRVDEILAHHAERLETLFRFCERERTLWEIAGELFGDLKGYNRLLGIEEAAAHVEYLVEEGKLGLVNPEALKSEPASVLKFARRTHRRMRGGGAGE